MGVGAGRGPGVGRARSPTWPARMRATSMGDRLDVGAWVWRWALVLVLMLVLAGTARVAVRAGGVDPGVVEGVTVASDCWICQSIGAPTGPAKGIAAEVSEVMAGEGGVPGQGVGGGATLWAARRRRVGEVLGEVGGFRFGGGG